MKFTKEHFEKLKAAIKANCPDVAAMKSDYLNKGRSETKFLWDLFWLSKYNMDQEFRDSDYTDKNIETAMKKAVRDLTAIQIPLVW